VPRKRTGWGGARPGAGQPPIEDSGAVRKSATTRLTAAERARIEAWGERNGLGFSEALRSAALQTVNEEQP
jgi:hypothetical protein